MSAEALKPHNNERLSRRDLLKLGAGAIGGAVLARSGLGRDSLNKASSLTEKITGENNYDVSTKHETSQIPNSPLGAYDDGWRIVVPRHQSHPQEYTAFIDFETEGVLGVQQRIEYANGKFAEGTQTVPWNEDNHMLTMLPLNADHGDNSAYVKYGESPDGQINSERKDRLELTVVPFGENVFLESEENLKTLELKKLSMSAEKIDRLLPSIYRENGKTIVLIPDVFSETAMLIDRSYRDRSVRGVVLPKDKIPLFESESSANQMFGELYFSAIGNAPDAPGEVDDEAVSAKQFFINDLNRRLLYPESEDVELSDALSLENYDADYKRYSSVFGVKSPTRIFGEMYAIANLFSEPAYSKNVMGEKIKDDRKVELRTIWNNFGRVLKGAVGDTAVDMELPGLQKIHDALIVKKVAPKISDSANKDEEKDNSLGPKILSE